MNDNYTPTAQRLMGELGWSVRVAVPSEKSGSRWERCGCDLLRDQLGYAVAQPDHLLPKSKCPELADQSSNCVNSYAESNTINSTSNVSDGMTVTAGSLANDRNKLIDKARAHLYARTCDRALVLSQPTAERANSASNYQRLWFPFIP